MMVTRVKHVCEKNNLHPDDNILKMMLLKYGPFSISFKASSSDYWTMLQGKYNEYCDPKARVSHAAVLVGYDRTHWILKNSYGNYPGETHWGVGGWLYVRKEVAASCGMFGFKSKAQIPFVV